MKTRNHHLLALASVFALASIPAQSSLVMHWKLDEADGDYTGGGYKEEVFSTTAIAREVATGTDVTEGGAGLAPDGGTSITVSDTASDSYVEAGNVNADGTYATGSGDSTYKTLNNNWTVTAWIRYTGSPGGDRVFYSGQWSNGGIFHMGPGKTLSLDYGSGGYDSSVALAADTTYFVSYQYDSSNPFGTGDRLQVQAWDGSSWSSDSTNYAGNLALRNMSIGRFTNGGREWAGQIDDVRIYDHTLTQVELDALTGVTSPLALDPINVTSTAYNEAEVDCSINLDTDAVTVYWGTSDVGETTVGWTGTPIVLGAQSAGSVPATITGLSENTTYFFRYFGSITAPAEDDWSSAGTFTTPFQNPLPLLGTPTATQTYDDGADVQCQLLDADATSTWVVWDTADKGTPASPPGTWANSSDLGSALVNANLTEAIEGDAGDTTYVFRFFASNGSGSDWSDLGTYDTGLGNEAAPTGLAVDLVDGTNVHLSWNDSYDTETGFGLERADDAAFTINVQTFNAAANATTYVDGSGDPATTYYYQVAAGNPGGTTPFSTSVMATTGAASAPVPVLHWKLDEADGDYTGGGYKEEVFSTTAIAREMATGTDVTEGGTGLAPDGGTSITVSDTASDSYVEAGNVNADGTYATGSGDSTYKNLNNNWTVTAWIRYTGSPGGDRVFYSGQWNNGGIFHMGPGKTLSLDYGSGGYDSTVSLAADTTYFVSYQYDSSNPFGTGHKLQVQAWDGSSWSSDSINYAGNLALRNMSIGRFSNGGREWIGEIDDVRIYDKTLTQADLNALAGASPPAGNDYSDWITDPAFGLDAGEQGLDQDPDGDGNDNGVENFFGTDPSAFSQGLVSGTYDAGAGTFTFTHPQNATPADDLTAAYQWSKDLQTFYPEGPGDGTTVAFSTSTDTGITTVTATVTGTIPDKLFVKVLVTQ